MNRGYTEISYEAVKLAYLAGIIDGEGSIFIGNFSSNKKTGAKYYQTVMSVTNTDKVLIDWLIDTFGGLLTKRSEKTTIKWGRKPVFTWTATGDRLTHLCEEIYPYVIIKRRQCEIMLKMRATYTGVCSKGKQGVQANSPELLNFRESLMQEMRSLHVRTHSWKND